MKTPRKIIVQRILPWVTLVLCGFLVAVDKPAIDPLKPPEVEMQLALTTIDNLNNKLTASKILSTKMGYGPQRISAKRAFQNAKRLFASNEHLSAVRELNVYLNLTQVPNSGPYLEAQYMLGRSYEEIELDQRAIRAYLRFLATFTTHDGKKYGTLSDVMQRLIPLAAKKSQQTNQDLRKLFSSVTSMNLPKASKAEVHYYAANTAAKTGSPDLASEWYQKAYDGSKDPALRSRTLYYQALLELTNENYEKAGEFLEKTLKLKDKGAAEYSDLARLALARVSVHLKNPRHALAHYQTIKDGSLSYKSAMFESVYVHLALGQTKEAQTKARKYLKRYPHGKQNFQLQTLLSYLDLRAGKLDDAKKGIDAADKELYKLGSWMHGYGGSSNRVTHTQVSNLVHRSDGVIDQSPTLKEGYKLFGTLAELSRRLADTRGNLRNLLFTLGRTNVEQYHPAWVRRSEQLSKISKDVLKVGHRLIASYKSLLKDKLSKVDHHELDTSQKRRTMLLSQVAEMRRQKDMWATWSSLSDLNQEIGRQHAKIYMARADLASARFLSINVDGKDRTTRQQKIERLSDIVDKAEKELMSALEVLRSKKIATLIHQSPHRSVRKLHSKYANALHNEGQILAQYFDKMERPAQRFFIQDAQATWKRWEFVSSRSYQDLSELDRRVSDELRSVLKGIETLSYRHDKLRAKLGVLTKRLESTMGQSMASLKAHFSTAINERKSKHHKWKADIEWLEYAQKNDEDKELNKKFDLEKQILRDNLQDLEQGVLWQWPQE